MAREKRSSKLKRNRIHIYILLVFILFAGSKLYKQEIMLREKRAELATVQIKQAELEAAIEILEAEIKDKDESDMRESLARKKLNMIRPDEIIYIIRLRGKGE